MIGDGVQCIIGFDWLDERSDEALDVVEDGHLSSPEVDLTTVI
jgi:hypothetical protein